LDIQQQLIQARQRQILTAAAQVFAEKGFHRATIRDIATAAGISDGTIYNYFENKDALLIGILDQLNETDERETHFEQGKQEDIQSFLTAYLRHRMEVMGPNIHVFRAILPEILTNDSLRHIYNERVIMPSMKLAEQFIASQMENGSLKQQDHVLVARAMAAQIFGFLMLHLLDDKVTQERWQELPDLLATMILEGLRDDNG
jgi:AcrR family transcriptional regulator